MVFFIFFTKWPVVYFGGHHIKKKQGWERNPVRFYKSVSFSFSVVRTQEAHLTLFFLLCSRCRKQQFDFFFGGCVLAYSSPWTYNNFIKVSRPESFWDFSPILWAHVLLSLQHTSHLLLTLPDQHDVISIMDQYKILCDVQMSQTLQIL